MIVKDEEQTILRVLKAARVFADEIIVVDTGSTDKTVELARSEGAKIGCFEWINDFAAARNYAFSLATCDYVMWLDADDVITPQRAKKLRTLVENLNSDIVMLPYYMGEPPSISFWRERIVRRSLDPKFKGRVHETIDVKGKVIYENIPIVHDKLKKRDEKRNLAIFEQMLSENLTLSGRELFYYGSELYYNGMYEAAQAELEKFLDQIGSNADKGQAALFLANMQKNDEDKQKFLIKGLEFAYSPDLLCVLGDVYIRQKNFSMAKACFLSALIADENITFPSPDCKSYLPHIRLCSCYWQLGDKSRAQHHNNAALAAKPNDFYATANLRLFM